MGEQRHLRMEQAQDRTVAPGSRSEEHRNDGQSAGIYMLTNASILLTGGTGSFGHAFVPMTLKRYNPRRLVIYSRGEMPQWEMAKIYGHDPRVRFFIGDVRDRERLYRALDGVDFVVHAAA